MMAGLQACNVMVETCIPALLPEVWQASCLCRKPLLRNLTQQPAELVELVKGMRSTLGEYDGMGWRFGTKQLYAILVSYSFMQCHYIIQWGQDTPWWDLPQSPSAKPGISLFPRVRSGRLCSLPLATGSGAPRLLDMNLYNPYPQEQTPCSMVRRGFWHFDSILPSIQWKCGHLGRHPSQLPLQLKLYALVDLHEGPGLESSIPWSILDSVMNFTNLYAKKLLWESNISSYAFCFPITPPSFWKGYADSKGAFPANSSKTKTPSAHQSTLISCPDAFRTCSSAKSIKWISKYRQHMRNCSSTNDCPCCSNHGLETSPPWPFQAQSNRAYQWLCRCNLLQTLRSPCPQGRNEKGEE